MTDTAERPLRAAYAPRHESYGPGAGLTLGLIGLGCVALSLFALSWVDAGNATFVELGRQARQVGTSALGVVALAYLTWAGFVLAALTAACVILAGIPVPRSAAGNTYARIIGALVAAAAAAAQSYTIGHALPAELVAPGAWVGVAGYLTAIAGFVAGARRRVR